MDLEAVRALVAVVELGSFVGAARRLGVPRPTLRRRLEALESEAGVPLLVRTRAGSTPTEAGAMLAARGRELLRDGAALMAAVREAGEEPSGELRLVLPVGTHPLLIAQLMAAMRRRYPKITVRLRTADDPLAALERAVDVAITFGTRQPGGRWVSMEILSIRQWLVASETYLAREGTPTRVSDLHAHELLAWAAPGEDATRWRLRSGGAIDVTPALISPDIHLLRQVAGAGLGIAYVPDGMLPEPGPPIVPVLAKRVGQERSLRVVVPAALEGTPRIRALLAELRAMRDVFEPTLARG